MTTLMASPADRPQVPKQSGWMEAEFPHLLPVRARRYLLPSRETSPGTFPHEPIALTFSAESHRFSIFPVFLETFF